MAPELSAAASAWNGEVAGRRHRTARRAVRRVDADTAAFDASTLSVLDGIAVSLRRGLPRRTAARRECGCCWNYHAADRLRAVAQSRRPADHLDLVRRQRIDRHEVVFAQVGRATAAHAIVDDADAVDVEAADDRPARCARRKARAGDAGFGEQHVAQRRAAGCAGFPPSAQRSRSRTGR